MNPADILQVLVRNIEIARKALDAGPCGYVLHTEDYTEFLCNDGGDGLPCLDMPLAKDVAVLQLSEALYFQTLWNIGLPDIDTGKAVAISLRRDALAAYIELQQMLLDALLDGARR